jgi:Mn-dependent DtxR family transcriptional regulator
MLTNRDKQYLKAIFLLQGYTHSVGPQELAKKMEVSKVCAFQKMRRLESMGYGEYTIRRGLKLNDNGVTIIENEIKNHHILEKFLEDTLKITFQEACDHSSHIAPFICDSLMNNIIHQMKTKINCNCGYCFDSAKSSNELENCHYLVKSV